MVPQIQFIGITGIPEVTEGDDLVALILSAAQAQGTLLEGGDVLVVTQKVVSKAEGAVVNLRDVTPSPLALEFAQAHNKDPRHVEVVLQESRRIVRMDRGVLIAETRHGFICANAGVDASNVPGEERVSLLPRDPDGSARGLREGMMARLGFPVAVIISDTFGRPWREGATDVVIGIAGMSPLKDYRGVTDPYGYSLQTTRAAIADEIASAAELVAGKVSLVPVSIARGIPYVPDEGATAKSLVRDASLDLFR
jgi:coenzyme F420-0:L-glutamate ligase/coenzyme F420-1:gamma-L-glutamate ligase